MQPNNRFQAPEQPVDKNIETKANAKEYELNQILDMFGSVIDKDIITDYWNGLNSDYEKTISVLSEMVDEIEIQKMTEQVPKPPPPNHEEEK